MKKILALLIVVMLLLTAGIVWVLMSFHIIDGQLYSKNAENLDLRSRKISAAHYEELAMRMPGCEILWNVPFQNDVYSSDSKELVLKDLTQDVQMLAYFKDLETLDARDCDDLSQLPVLQDLCPDVTILAQVNIQGQTLAYDTTSVKLDAIAEDELALLPILSKLELVEVTDTGDPQNFRALRDYCKANAISFRMVINGEAVTAADKSITLDRVTDAQVELLKLMPWLESVHLPEPEAAAENLFALEEVLADVQVTWEKTVLGVTFDRGTTEVDLTKVIARAEGEAENVKTAYEYGLEYPVMGDREKEPKTAKVLRNHPFPDKTEDTDDFIAEVEAAMAYFPEAEQVLMCGAWLDNEKMAEFRERHREDYKVVWSVLCGDVSPRTDATFFMPTKYGVGSGGFNELYSENLKYCEEIVSMDIGHMQIVSIDFVRYMPNLKYLVLFSQPIYDLAPLAECKNLVFLELSMCSWISDYTPLLGCTALEDLNIEQSSGDITPLLEMTWLKNLWLGDRGVETYNRAKTQMPDTNVVYMGSSQRWRSLPNYFKMRDALLMFYMS